MDNTTEHWRCIDSNSVQVSSTEPASPQVTSIQLTFIRAALFTTFREQPSIVRALSEEAKSDGGEEKLPESLRKEQREEPRLKRGTHPLLVDTGQQNNNKSNKRTINNK